MDISSLYTQYDTTAADASTSSMEKSLGSDYSSATDDELMDVCKQFESYFIEQMFKEMEKTVPENEESDKSNSSLVNYFKDNMIQEYAAEASDQGNYGLAQTLYEQMKRNYGI